MQRSCGNETAFSEKAPETKFGGDMAVPDSRALLEHAWSLVEMNRLSEARSLFGKICEADSLDPEPWMMLGSLHAEFSEDDDAERCLKRSLELDPNYPDAHFNFAKLRLKRGDVAGAERHCGLAVANDSEYAAAWQLLGVIQEGLGNVAEAEDSSRRSIALMPENAAAHANLALVLWKQGRLSDSIQSYETAASLDPRSAEIQMQMAAVYVHLARFADAERCYRRVIEIAPRNSQATAMLGHVLSSMGRIDEEIDVLLQGARNDPASAQIQIQLGKACHARRDWEQAKRAFLEAVRLAPQDPEGHFGLGAIAGALGQRKDEIAHFEEAMRLAPDNEEYKFHVARLTGSHTPPTAPLSYVRTLFDAAAETFDSHLVDQLGYRGHDVVYQVTLEHMGSSMAGLDILDIGCGTGLCAPRFRPHAKRMVGIDLSEKMVSVARRRALYDELIVGDISQELMNWSGRVDLIIAADVFIYVGELKRVFELCVAALKEGGLFVFTVESARTEGESLVLGAAGRYAHSLSYIGSLAAAHGLEACTIQNVVLRSENEAPVPGQVFVMRR